MPKTLAKRCEDCGTALRFSVAEWRDWGRSIRYSIRDIGRVKRAVRCERCNDKWLDKVLANTAT